MSDDRTCPVCNEATMEVYCPLCGYNATGERIPFGDLSAQERSDVEALLALAVHRQGVWQAHLDEMARLKSMGVDVSGMDPGKYDTAIAVFSGPITRLRPVLWSRATKDAPTPT